MHEDNDRAAASEFEGLRCANAVLSFLEASDDPQPATPLKDALGYSREKPATVVVVVGKTGRGKSSLLNALLGRPGLLPVDFRAATSTCLIVRHGQQERAFVEGSTDVEIKLEDLGNWATLAGERQRAGGPDRGVGEPAPPVVIEIPDSLLGEGLVVIDTPGVGGLGTPEEVATFAARRRADAVIFVLDPSVPVSPQEINFAKSVTESIRTAVFVLAKIDKDPDWKRTASEDQQLISARLGGALAESSVIVLADPDPYAGTHVATDTFTGPHTGTGGAPLLSPPRPAVAHIRLDLRTRLRHDLLQGQLVDTRPGTGGRGVRLVQRIPFRGRNPSGWQAVALSGSGDLPLSAVVARGAVPEEAGGRGAHLAGRFPRSGGGPCRGSAPQGIRCGEGRGTIRTPARGRAHPPGRVDRNPEGHPGAGWSPCGYRPRHSHHSGPGAGRRGRPMGPTGAVMDRSRLPLCRVRLRRRQPGPRRGEDHRERPRRHRHARPGKPRRHRSRRRAVPRGGHHVGREPPDRWQQLSSPTDDDWLRARADTLERAMVAKEVLAQQPSTKLLIRTPDGGGPAEGWEVEFSRRQFDRFIEPVVRETVNALDSITRRNDLPPGTPVYLSGGSSCTGLVRTLLGAKYPLVGAGNNGDFPEQTVVQGAVLMGRMRHQLWK